MRIRTFIALVCALTILVIGVVLSREADQTLGHESRDLERLHRNSVAEFTKSVIEGRLYLLSAYRENLDSGSKLAKLFLVAPGTKGSADLRSQLAAIRARTKCDIVDLVQFDSRQGFLGSLPESLWDTIPAVRTGKSRTRLVRFNGHPALISTSPLRLFDEPVGIAVLGFFLDGEAARSIKHSTGTDVRVVLPDEPGVRSATFIEVAESTGGIGKVGLSIGTGQVATISRGTRTELLRAGVLCLLLVLVILYALLEFGFLRRFKAILRDISQSSRELAAGRVLSVERKWHPIREVSEMSRAFVAHLGELRTFQERVETKTRTEALGEVAAQVAHDLKGLLSTIELKLDLDHEQGMPTEKKDSLKRLFARVRGITSTVVGRIRAKHGLVEKIDPQGGLSEEPMTQEPAYLLVDAIVAEKAFQYGDLGFLTIEMEVAKEAYDSFISVQTNEFKRLLANLIDNAVEATGSEGIVSVLLSGGGGTVTVEVRDSGRGIPADVLPRLFVRGASFGKASGSGLGLWHAKLTLNEWRGTISLLAREGGGTTVQVQLPRVATPALFVTELYVVQTTELIVLDDVELVHDIWEQRILEANRGGLRLRLRKFRAPREIKEWLGEARENRHADQVFLFDFNLVDAQYDGLRLIRELAIESSSVLVTGLGEDPSLRAACQAAGVRMLPKPMLPFVRISLIAPRGLSRPNIGRRG